MITKWTNNSRSQYRDDDYFKCMQTNYCLRVYYKVQTQQYTESSVYMYTAPM